MAQRGRTLELTFSLPELATDGERLTKPLEVEILRGVFPPGQPGPAAPGALGPWKVLLGEVLARVIQGEKVVFPFTLSSDEFGQQRGGTFAFGVRTLTRGFRRHPFESDLSNVVQAILVDVPVPVANLQVHTEEHALALSWSAPAKTISGQPATNLSAYRIYRSKIGRAHV